MRNNGYNISIGIAKTFGWDQLAQRVDDERTHMLYETGQLETQSDSFEAGEALNTALNSIGGMLSLKAALPVKMTTAAGGWLASNTSLASTISQAVTQASLGFSGLMTAYHMGNGDEGKAAVTASLGAFEAGRLLSNRLASKISIALMPDKSDDLLQLSRAPISLADDGAPAITITARPSDLIQRTHNAMEMMPPAYTQWQNAIAPLPKGSPLHLSLAGLPSSAPGEHIEDLKALFGEKNALDFLRDDLESALNPISQAHLEQQAIERGENPAYDSYAMAGGLGDWLKGKIDKAFDKIKHIDPYYRSPEDMERYINAYQKALQARRDIAPHVNVYDRALLAANDAAYFQQRYDKAAAVFRDIPEDIRNKATQKELVSWYLELAKDNLDVINGALQLYDNEKVQLVDRRTIGMIRKAKEHYEVEKIMAENLLKGM